MPNGKRYLSCIMMKGKDGFYQSKQWRNLRKIVATQWQTMGLPCALCGAHLNWDKPKAVIVDHVISRHTRPDLALSMDNLVCVCHQCNSIKALKYGDNAREAREAMRKEKIDHNGFPPGWRD